MYFIIVNSQVIANTSFLLDLWRLCANKDCSYSKDDIQSVGRIYLFQFALTGTPQPLTTITGHKTFMKLGSSLAVGNPYNNSFVNKDNDMLAVSATTLSKFPLLACLVVPVSDQRVKYQWVEWVHDSWVKSKIVENYFAQKKMILCMKKKTFQWIMWPLAILKFISSIAQSRFFRSYVRKRKTRSPGGEDQGHSI